MPNLEAFGNRMIEYLPRLMQELSRHERNSLTRGVITLPQFRALDYLTQHGACQMYELASALHLARPSMTGLMDRMVRHQWVARTHGREDRRAVHVVITAKGRRIVAEIYEQKRKGIMQLFGRLTIQERSRYLEIIGKLVQELSSRP